MKDVDAFIIVDVWGPDGYYTHPGPVMAQSAEIFEAVDKEGIREVVLFHDDDGKLVGVFVPEKDAIISIGLVADRDGELVRLIPVPPPGRRIYSLKIEGKGVQFQEGPMRLPPYIRERRLYARLILPDGSEDPGVHVAPPGTMAIMLGRAVEILPEGKVLPVPPEIKKVESEVDEENGVGYINLYDHTGKLVHRFSEKIDPSKGKFGFKLMDAVLGVDLKNGLFVVTPIPKGHGAKLGVLKMVRLVDDEQAQFADDTPAPPKGHKWVKILITPDGVSFAAD